MGIPVLIAGRSLGGTLTSEDDYNFQVETNFNSDMSNSKGLEEDIQKIKQGSSIVPLKFSHDK